MTPTPSPTGTTAPEANDPFRALPELPAEVQTALRQIAQAENYADGRAILNEGDCTDDLYLVAGGKVEVFRASHGQQEEQHVITLEGGSLLGELALIDGAPRSLSARADGDCQLLRISPRALRALPDGDRLLTSLKANLGAAVVRRMRQLTDNYVGELEGKLAIAREQHQFGQFFLYVLVVLAIGMLVNNAIARQQVDVNIYSLQFVWQYSVLLLIPSVFIVRKLGIPLDQLGVSRQGLKPSLIEGGVISAIMISATLLLVLVGVLPGKGLTYDPIGTGTYVLHSFLQELFGRGFLLSSFQRFLNDQRGIKSLVVSSLFFGLFHLHFGLSAVAITSIGGVVFGAFYLRHRNLAGVTLVHTILGMCAFASGLIG